ncbi:TPA: restriction endonuclease subunit S [Campylobacter jejuni]|nr:restriction endonuclease subunit S [Campylobacter jejuni]HDZ5083307.1 restriction endonuclease subunit S [Campylobacter jejuni]HDZ5096727.1 restriction endonuclease subunit S [Campylobacter jejuni]
MKNDLASVEWREFKISDIFDIYTGALINQNEIKQGKIPRITATDLSNGIAFFTDNLEHKNFRTLENFISISFLGSVFYHKNKVSLDMKIHGIKLKNKELNCNIALFLIPLIKKFAFKYSYGYQLSTSVLKNQKLLLPIDSKGNLNYSFMESYMKEIEQNYIKNILSYYNKKLLSYGGGVLPSCNNTFREQSIFIEDGLMKIAKENLKLESIKWKEFVIGEIFEVRATLSGIDKNKLNGKKGIYPYITRSDKTNGVDSFIAKQDVYHYNEANVITIGLDTQTAFYQSDKFYTGQNIQILTYKELNKYNALFIIILLKKLMEKFSWGGNGATLARLKRGKIILPIDSNGNPDYKFMESYMKAIEKEHLEKITAYYNAKLAKVDRGGGFDLDEYKDFIKQDKLKNIQWKEFDFADIFKEIKRGKRLIKDNQIQGKTPYVSSSAFDNGIDNFINNNENVRKFNNCISLANSGSVGNAFFHSYEFVASDHITQLIQPKFNKYIYLFLLPIITRLSEKYSFNREINDKRIKREKLLLPIDFKGNPNWQFMENYIRDIEYKKINNIINCYQKKIR